MRKLILVFAAFAISVGVFAQAGSTNKTTSPQNVDKTQNQNLQNQQDLNKTQNQNLQNQQDLNRTQNQNLQNNQQGLNNNQQSYMQNNPLGKTHSDGVIMRNGKIMKVEKGEMTILDKDVTVNNGTKIMSDGTYINKDGSKMTMTEGQHIDMEGNMISINTNRDRNIDYDQNNQQNLNRNQNQNSQSQQNLNRTQNQNSQQDKNWTNGQSSSEVQPTCSGVVMINGKMMNMNNGTMSPFDDNGTSMINGTKIKSDGTYTQKNGSKMKMKEGYHMDMAGNIMVPLKTTYNKNGTQKGNLNSTDKSSSDKTQADKSSTQKSQKSTTDNSSTDRTYNTASGTQSAVQNNSNDKSNVDGIVFENGKLMKVKNGQKTILQDNDMTMSNGTKLTSDGTYTKKDGSKLTFKEGEHMDMSGNMLTIKTNQEKNMYLVPDTTRNREN